MKEGCEALELWREGRLWMKVKKEKNESKEKWGRKHKWGKDTAGSKILDLL